MWWSMALVMVIRATEPPAWSVEIYDYDAPTPLTGDNAGGHFVFGMSSRDVKSVMVDGKMVYEDRQFPFDTAPIYAQAQKEAQRLWQRMDALD